MRERTAERAEGAGALADRVGSAAKRKLRAQCSKDRSVWMGLGAIGVIGWSVVVPTLIGAGMGTWLDRHYPGRHAWTLALMVGGLCLGCMNAWRWVSQENHAMVEEGSDDGT